MGKDSIDSGISLVSSPESSVGLTGRPNPMPSSLGLDLARLFDEGWGDRSVGCQEMSFWEDGYSLLTFFNKQGRRQSIGLMPSCLPPVSVRE